MFAHLNIQHSLVSQSTPVDATVALHPLQVLASKFLKRSIQAGEHDSAIDARTAMDLALLKIKHGPSFGSGDGTNGASEKLADHLADFGHRSCLVDRKDMLTRFATGARGSTPAAVALLLHSGWQARRLPADATALRNAPCQRKHLHL